MEGEPLVSVIIPCYNIADFISACLSSVFSQTYKNLQIIIIDDGSTDKTGEKLNRLAKLDNRIELIHQKNAGLSEARNTGLKRVKGEYVAFVDGDDYLDEKYIEKLLGAITSSGADVAICRYSEDINGKLKKSRGSRKKLLLSRKEALSEFLTQKLGTGAVVWNKLYKTEIFKKNGLKFPKGKLHEDNFIMPEILKNTKKVALIPDRLYFYRRTEKSITGQMSKKRLKDACESVENTKKLLKNENLETELEAYELNQKFYLQKISNSDKLKSELKAKKREILKNPYTSKTLKINALTL